MNYLHSHVILNIKRPLLVPIKQLIFQTNSYAKKEAAAVSMLGAGLKKKKAKVGPVVEKRILPVETDPERLVSYVCGSNILKTGEDIKIQPKSEYPEWLWTLRTGRAPTIEELDPDSIEYWRKVRKMAIRHNNKLRSLKKF